MSFSEKCALVESMFPDLEEKYALVESMFPGLGERCALIRHLIPHLNVQITVSPEPTLESIIRKIQEHDPLTLSALLEMSAEHLEKTYVTNQTME